jgi:hypothetical protein
LLPVFIVKTGMPTHFDAPDCEPIAIETHAPPMSDHVRAAHAVRVPRFPDQLRVRLPARMTRHRGPTTPVSVRGKTTSARSRRVRGDETEHPPLGRSQVADSSNLDDREIAHDRYTEARSGY